MSGHLTAQQRKQKGAHYTPFALAQFVARQICDAAGAASDTDRLRILDPAVGDGKLTCALLREMYSRGSGPAEVTAFDTDREALSQAERRLAAGGFVDVLADWREESFPEFALTAGDEPYDLVIANPPYVRTQVLGLDASRRIAKRFGLRGRIDLCYAFLFGIAEVLKPRGIAGVIVSNRFLSTQAGASVRAGLLKRYDLLHVWDLGDTKLFDAAVLPAVLLLQKKDPSVGSVRGSGFTTVYSCATAGEGTECVENILSVANGNGCFRLPDGSGFRVVRGKLDTGEALGDVWRLSTPETDAWLRRVDAHTGLRFGDVGKIRVGVKTTADSVFIRSDWHEPPERGVPELLLPLITHHMARRYKAADLRPRREILYPHCVEHGCRQAVDLARHPHAATYLAGHRPQLEGREYVKRAGRQWYEIWVPQDPDAWKLPKLVFRDISERPTFWMDLSGSVVNGDCYWMCATNKQEESLLWLALGVANSRFVERYYDVRFNNRLYAGRRRFMTQYVEAFPLPDPACQVAQEIAACSRALYDAVGDRDTQELERELDGLVFRAFGVADEEKESPNRPP
jgi:adenine-specific DNA-methyltransferase